VYSFGRAALLLLVEVYNHTVPVRERRRIRVNEELQGHRMMTMTVKFSTHEKRTTSIM